MEASKLREWKASLETEAHVLHDRIQSLSGELQKKNEQIELIGRLIDSVDGVDSRGLQRGSNTSGNSVPVTPGQVKDCVFTILSEVKRPMNIKEIHAEFIRRGYSIPGKGTPFNILVHVGRELKLGRKARFCRTGRGTYSLRNHPSDGQP